ncbi:T9SS type A sorting domain-containing protein [Prolixibacteraceae bacterium Z1-6]|uniref:T9SS type A sorting domain-containing protein n=1 Tax=Draconibacterium aestuarii TaxID=2998507 RepID=A0A9X3F7T9_9BACT|nr:T9SS type A sorting domain-containing protein [Prolixibacteraceae bacterium Z1-6]
MKKNILLIILLLLIYPAFAQTSWDESIYEKSKIETELQIYPNPCKNSKVTVDFKSHNIVSIKLTNITGKQVLFEEYEIPINKTQLLLNDIPNGVYIMQVITSNQISVVKKLIISRN